MDPLSFDFWQGIAAVLLCGGTVGLERELHDKPAGVKTCIFVCLGAMLFMRLGEMLAGPQTDPTRVLGQVITGIGFLGAGVILAHGESVKGVTTAGVIWLEAAIGAMIAARLLVPAILVTLVVLLVLTVLDHWVKRLERRHRERHPQIRPD
jgi:putative Mg2+ transporter-C (MgtC) family protein